MLTFNYALLCLVAVHMSIYAWLNDAPFLFHLYIPHILLFLTSYERQKKKRGRVDGLRPNHTAQQRECWPPTYISIIVCWFYWAFLFLYRKGCTYYIWIDLLVFFFFFFKWESIDLLVYCSVYKYSSSFYGK